ncbi:MAG: prepilin peptidase [Candidatus Berkelbacteria bacterium]|nr:prepilin peptidase [Candidatus Berkelbacteria bacterium]
MLGVVIAFLFGLAYGSFLNVVILRFDDLQSIAKDRSHCPNCKTQLSWWDLVPLFSFAYLQGKCRYCKKPISWQYPIVELLTAVLVAASYYLLFTSQNLVMWQSIVGMISLIIVIGSMMTILVHDLTEMMVPDLMSNLLLGASIVFTLVVHHDPLGLLYSALVGFLPIMLLVLPSRGKWMGEGDIKIAGALAILVNWPNAVAFLILTFLLGGIFGSVALATKRVKMKTAVPFGPFLIIASIIILFWGDSITSWYLGTIGYGYY